MPVQKWLLYIKNKEVINNSKFQEAVRIDLCYFFLYLLVCLKNISFYNLTIGSAVHILNSPTSSTSLFVCSVLPS